MRNALKPEAFTSRWEYSKATSNWHFDKFKDEDGDPPFTILGRFKEGRWQHEFDEIFKSAKTTPVTFGTRIARAMPGVAPYTTALDNHDLIKMGLPVGHQLYDSIDLPESAYWLRKMAGFFRLSNARIAIHIQFPGQVFPYHVDNLTGTRANQPDHAIDDDPQSMARIEIQLKDWEWGHVWAYGNTYWKQWRAGEMATHNWRDIPHGTANLGHTPRCLLQVTGLVSDFTRELLKKKNLSIDLDTV